MDRVTQRRKKGNRLIAQRYLLQTELVNNSAGTLYQARDLRASDTAKAAVLIHILPSNTLLQLPLKLMTERLQALSTKTDAAVLKVIDSGWLNSEPYFVLVSPPSWSLSALPPMLGQSTRLHEQALRLNQQLTEQGLVTSALPTSLFLVSADGLVYLPSTVLAPRLQTFTESPELLLQAHLQAKRISFSAWPWLGLGVIGVVAASSAGLYYQNYLMTTQAKLSPRSEAANSENLLETKSEWDLPRATISTIHTERARPPLVASAPSSSLPPLPSPVAAASPPEPVAPIDLTLTDTQILPDPEPGDMRLALANDPPKPQAAPVTSVPVSNSTKTMPDKNTPPIKTSSESAKTPKPEKNTRPKTPTPEKKPITNPEPETSAEFVEETDPSVNLPSPATPLIKAVEQAQLPKAQAATANPAPPTVTVIPTLQPVQTINTTAVLGVVNPIAKPIVKQTPAPPIAKPVARLPVSERDPELLTANGLTSDELVKKAYQALQANRLDEQANRGAVYFIRLLERIDHGNPQIIRLAREISYQLHQQVRVALIQGDTEQASQKLWRAGRIIKEFNLVHLNPAQEILEHKLAE